MATIHRFPHCQAFFSVQEVQGVPCLFTHCNAQGLGFLTYTALDYALGHSIGLRMDGSARRFTVEEMQAIRACPEVAAFGAARRKAAKDFYAMLRA